MAVNKGRAPSRHDRTVKREAIELKKEGWNVKADLKGFEQPDPIGRSGRIPDIVATKRGHRKIIEVETPTSVVKDKEQLSTFRRHAAQKPNTTFEVIETDG